MYGTTYQTLAAMFASAALAWIVGRGMVHHLAAKLGWQTKAGAYPHPFTRRFIGR